MCVAVSVRLCEGGELARALLACACSCLHVLSSCACLPDQILQKGRLHDCANLEPQNPKPQQHSQACVLALLCVALQESVELRPMFGAADAGDASAASDSGGASFLGQLWQAVQVRQGRGGGSQQTNLKSS